MSSVALDTIRKRTDAANAAKTAQQQAASQADMALARAIAATTGKARFNLDILEIFAVLVHLGYAQPHSQVYPLTIPAGATGTITLNTPSNQIINIQEYSLLATKDLVLSLTITNDTLLLHNDPSVVSSLYNPPVNFFGVGILIPTKNKLVITLTNSDSSQQTVYFWAKFIQSDKAFHIAVEEQYFALVRSVIGGL